MDNFDDLAYIYAMNMINEHEMAIHNPRRGFSVKYDPFTQCERIFLKNYRLSKDLVRQLIFMVTPYIDPPSRSSSINIPIKVSTKYISKY